MISMDHIRSCKGKVGLINDLTRAQGEIQDLIYAGGTLDDVKSRKKVQDEPCREFVGIHEQYLELLVSKEEEEIACLGYKEQMTRKIRFVELIESWCERSNSKQEKGKKKLALSQV